MRQRSSPVVLLGEPSENRPNGLGETMSVELMEDWAAYVVP